MSIYKNSKPAYLNEPVEFTLSELFDNPAVGLPQQNRDRAVVIYPDPAQESISVAGIYNGNYLLEITNLNGRIVQTVRGGFPGTRVPVSSLPAGFYTLRLTGIDFLYTGRFVKDH